MLTKKSKSEQLIFGTCNGGIPLAKGQWNINRSIFCGKYINVTPFYWVILICTFLRTGIYWNFEVCRTNKAICVLASTGDQLHVEKWRLRISLLYPLNMTLSIYLNVSSYCTVKYYFFNHQWSTSAFNITMTSWWPRWRLQSTASRLFTQPFSQTHIKETIKAPLYWPLCGEFTGTGEFPSQRASYAESVSIWWRHLEKVCGASIKFPTSKIQQRHYHHQQKLHTHPRWSI